MIQIAFYFSSFDLSLIVLRASLKFFIHELRRLRSDLLNPKFAFLFYYATIVLSYSIFRTTPEVSIKLIITKEMIFGFQILDLKDHF